MSIEKYLVNGLTEIIPKGSDHHDRNLNYFWGGPIQRQFWEQEGLAVPISLSIACSRVSDRQIYDYMLSYNCINYMYLISGQYDDNTIEFFSTNHRGSREKRPHSELVASSYVNLAEILPKEIPSSTDSDSSLESEPVCINNTSNHDIGMSDLIKQCCCHCHTTKTSLWRRRGGKVVCNACALYEKLHGAPRPAHLLNQVLRRRNRSEHFKRGTTRTKQ